MTLRRGFALSFLVASFTAACSGGPGAIGTAGEGPGTSGSDGRGGDTTSGSEGGGAEPTTSTPLPITESSVVTLASGTCGLAPGSCGASKNEQVDLGSGTFTRTTCVEQPDASPAREPVARTLSEDELRRTRDVLALMRYAHATSKNYDGIVTGVTVEDDGQRREFLREGGCSPSEYEKIVAGLPELQALFASF